MRYRGRSARQMRNAKALLAKLHGFVEFARGDRYLFWPAIDRESVRYVLSQVVSLDRLELEIDVPRSVVERWIGGGRLPALEGHVYGDEVTLVSPIAARRLARAARQSPGPPE
jgi:hypothetical protein